MAGELGRASYALDADLEPLRRNVKQSRVEVSDFERVLDSLTAIADIASEQLKQVKITPRQGQESRTSASGIIEGVRGIKDESREAAREIDKVRITERQAAESDVAGDIIDRKLKDITGNANEARRSLESVRIAGAGAAGAGGGNRNPGAGIGPFGSGFGRIGLLGAAIGGGTLLGPAAGPAAVGLLGALPVFASAGAGALGTLALAFDGVGKAIGGDKRAFDELGPSAQAFVQTIRSLDGWFEKLKETAAGSLFPGLTAGLKSALSSGTVSALTNAVAEFGHAIGDAGAAWGKYFGSAQFQNIFGPLMASGARNFSSMSDAALHLFDALGVLGRAAIPFTEWMVKGIDAGSRWADAFMRAKDASGGLGGALNEAQTSLRLVGNLFVSIGRAVYELGAALYPVSKIAVKDLTDGFNALSQIIDRNKQTIRDIVSGALSALVSMIKALVPVVTALAHGIEDVVHSIGGWKVAFEIILGGMLAAKVAKLGGAFYDLAGSIASIGPKIGKIGLAADTAVGEVGGLRAMLLSLSASDVLIALGLVSAAVYAIYESVTTQTYPGAKPSGRGANPTSSGSAVYTRNGVTYEVFPGAKPGRGEPFTGTAQDGTIYKNGKAVGRATAGPGGAHGGGDYAASSYGLISGPGDFADESAPFKFALSALSRKYGPITLDSGYRSEASQDALWDASVKAGRTGFMANGNPIARPANRGGSGSDHSRGTAADGTILYNGKRIPLSSLPASVLAAYGLSTVPGDVGHVMLANGGVVDTASPFSTPGAFTKNLGPKTAMPTGANLLPEALRNALQAAKDKATTTQGATAAVWLHRELADLEKARKDLEGQLAGSSGKKRAAIQAELRSIDGQIATVNKSITTNLHQQAQAVKTAFSSKISAAKSKITSAIETLKGTLDAQLQEHLQTQIDTVLAPKFFQGTDEHGMPLQTPAEAKLAGEQAADTLKSLQDAITQATDPESRAAAQRQLDEYNDSIAATKERAQADRDFADAVKKAQADEAESQRQLNLQLDVFGKGLANGTTKLGDLGSLVEAFGLSLTAPGGITEDFAYLQGAVSELAGVLIAKAQALGAVGDAKDAHAAALAAAGLVIPAGAPTVIPGTRIDFAGLIAAAMARNAIGMAAGGIGRATMPTLFYSGGDEDFAFSGEGSSFADASSGREEHLHIHGGTFIGGNKQQVARDLKPYLERITTLTK